MEIKRINFISKSGMRHLIANPPRPPLLGGVPQPFSRTRPAADNVEKPPPKKMSGIETTFGDLRSEGDSDGGIPHRATTANHKLAPPKRMLSEPPHYIRTPVPPILIQSPRIRTDVVITANGAITDLGTIPQPKGWATNDQTLNKTPSPTFTNSPFNIVDFDSEEMDKVIPTPCDTPARLHLDLHLLEAKEKAEAIIDRHITRRSALKTVYQQKIKDLIDAHARDQYLISVSHNTPRRIEVTKEGDTFKGHNLEKQRRSNRLVTSNQTDRGKLARLVARQKSELIALDKDYGDELDAIKNEFRREIDNPLKVLVRLLDKAKRMSETQQNEAESKCVQTIYQLLEDDTPPPVSAVLVLVPTHE